MHYNIIFGILFILFVIWLMFYYWSKSSEHFEGTILPLDNIGDDDVLDDEIVDLRSCRNIANNYYNKYRELQNIVARQHNELIKTKNSLDSYRRQFLLCKRQLTLKPVTVGYIDSPHLIGPNYGSGAGIVTPIKLD